MELKHFYEKSFNYDEADGVATIFVGTDRGMIGEIAFFNQEDPVRYMDEEIGHFVARKKAESSYLSRLIYETKAQLDALKQFEHECHDMADYEKWSTMQRCLRRRIEDLAEKYATLKNLHDSIKDEIEVTVQKHIDAIEEERKND